MATRIVADEVKWMKCPAPNVIPGLTRFKDYKLVRFVGGVLLTEGDAFSQIMPNGRWRFTEDGCIVYVSLALVGGDMREQVDEGGGVIGAVYVRLNNQVDIAIAYLCHKQLAAALNTERTSARDVNMVYPNIYVPITEDDEITLLVDIVDYRLPPDPLVDASELDWRIVMAYVEKD